jgi:hypothetical protein
LKFVVGIVVVSVSAASCVGEPTVTERTPPPRPPTAVCSAARIDAPREPSGLPVAVAMMRKEVIKAAIRCEYDVLERLALNGSPTFSYSFGEASEGPDARPGAYWEAEEKRDEPALGTIVRLFGLPFAVTNGDETIYAWPSAAGDAPSEDDWKAVEREFGRETAEGWRGPEGYLGPRIGITARGDWIFYVAGD